MNFNFNYYHQLNDVELYLCNPDGRELFPIIAYDRNVTLRFNDLSKIEFKAPATITKEDGTVVIADYYDYLETKRIIEVTNIGFFQISRVEESDDGIIAYKLIEAESLQSTFKDRGITTEERIYCFYNPRDPYDDAYHSSDDGAIPSVIGQVCKQLNVELDIHNTEISVNTPYEKWTVIYINPALYYYENSGSPCRTFKEQTSVGYDFLVTEVENAFNVVVLFDFRTRSISIKTVNEITERANLCLSFANLLENITISEDADNIVTVLNCNGENLNILSVNPTGTNYIVDFSYYMDEVEHRWMSSELIAKLKVWQQEVEDNKDDYEALVQTLKTQYYNKQQVDNSLQEASVRSQDLDRAAAQYAEYQISDDDQATTSTLLGIVMAENVNIDQKSLSVGSSYYSAPFTGHAIVTAYQSAPTFNDEEWTFTGASKTDYADNLCAEISSATTPYLYFSDGDFGAYCKLKSRAERQTDGTFTYSCAGFEKYIGMNAVRSRGSGEVKHSDNIATVSVNMATFKSNVAQRGASADILKNKFTFTYTPDPALVGPYQVLAAWKYNGEVVNMSDWGISYTTAELQDWDYIQISFTPDVAYWKELQENNAVRLQGLSADYQALINATTASLNAISDHLNILNYFSNTPTLLKELSNYWIEGDYTNENYAVLEGTTAAEEIELANELLEAGKFELSKVSQPHFSFSANANNLLGCYEFQDQIKELELGRVITIEKDDGLWYYPALLEIEFNLDEVDDFSMTFANATRLDDWGYTFADMITDSSNTSRQVNANWQNLMSYVKDKSLIESLIKNPLDATLKAAVTNMSNQEFSVTDQGILGRKSDGNDGFEDEQVRLINNLMMFTDDNWKTSKTALGKIYYTDTLGRTTSSYGLIAETIIGEMILGETLKIVNRNNSFTIDDDGMNFNDNFIVDASGNVQLNGSITWGTGSSPTQVLYAYDAITKPTNNTAWNSYPETSATGWHRTYASGTDFFMSCTYDGGTSWTEPIRFAGQNGTNGDDGDSIGSVYLYHRATTVSTPTYVDNYSTNISSHGWTTTPTGTNSTYLYEYALPYSEVIDGVTGVTTYTRTGTPAIWAKYGSDANVTSANVFAALTNDGQIFGCFSDNQGSLYINATYINTGELTVSNSYGTVFSAHITGQSAGTVTMTNWTVGQLPGTSTNGIYNIANISGTNYIYGLQASSGNSEGIFFVKQGSDMTGTATFYVLPSGFMRCTAGKIGGWELYDGKYLKYDTTTDPLSGSGAWEITGYSSYAIGTSSSVAIGTITNGVRRAAYVLSTDGLRPYGVNDAAVSFADTSITGHSGSDIVLRAGSDLSADNCIYLRGRAVVNSSNYGSTSDMNSITSPQTGQIFFVI